MVIPTYSEDSWAFTWDMPSKLNLWIPLSWNRIHSTRTPWSSQSIIFYAMGTQWFAFCGVSLIKVGPILFQNISILLIGAIFCLGPYIWAVYSPKKVDPWPDMSWPRTPPKSLCLSMPKDIYFLWDLLISFGSEQSKDTNWKM